MEQFQLGLNHRHFLYCMTNEEIEENRLFIKNKTNQIFGEYINMTN
jgi:hypothetical protein